MSKEYVEQRDGSFYVTGSRVPMASIIYDFQNGDAPETIQTNFPTLSLEQVYGAIAFYLGNRQEIERDISERRRLEHEFIQLHPNPVGIKDKLLRRREQMLSRQI